MPLRYVIAALLMFTCVVSAQSPNGARLRGETEAAQTRKRIAEAIQKIEAGQTAEAVDELQRVLEESGNDLVAVKVNNFQTARRLVQLTLAGLPAEALKTYRDRLEAPAKKLLDAGVKNRDPKPLLELRERYFIARPTEKALDFLGELHFERGEFAEAERYWRMLLPATDANELVYPQPAGDAATYRAKAILAAFAAGEKARSTAELAAFAKEHPQAKGRLAGSDGAFAETLAKVFKAEEFNPAIGVAQSLPRLPAMRPIWKTPIPRDVTDKSRPRPASIPAAKTLAFHPVIVNGYAYICDAARVMAFNLKDGKSRIVYDLRKEPGFVPDSAELTLPNLRDTSYTLTVAEGKLYVRMGSTVMPGGADTTKPKTGSTILAFEVQVDGSLKMLWNLPPPASVTWEGSPVVVDGAVIPAFSRIDDRGRLVHSIASYPESLKDKANWITEIAESDANQSTPRTRQELLTLAGNKVVFTTHSGLTVALDRSTGRAAWAFRNPPMAKPSNAIRDLNPPVYASGKVFIAPTDGDRLYALDAESGRLVWESAAGSVQQILGVADGKLIVAMSGPQKGIRGYRLSDGSTQEPFGWQNHDDPFLATYGKGLASENGILWPTMEKLYRLNPSDGSVQSLPKPGPHGNLSFGEGMLLVATPTEIWAYEGIPFSPELESPKPALPNKLISAPKPVGEFDPLTAPTIKLPLKLDRTEIVPLGVSKNHTEQIPIISGSSITHNQWSLDALGRNRPSAFQIASAPTFSPFMLEANNGIWVQTSQAERWFVDAKTGKILHREKTAEALWLAPPVALPQGKLVFSDGPGLVRCYDASHRKHWSYEAGGEASLSGIPPQECVFGNVLFIAVHRNYGIEIQRLDPNTGRALWRKPAVVNTQQFDWAAACIDRTSLFIPLNSCVMALDVGSGREEAWKAEQSLGSSPKAVRGRHTLFVYSSQPMPAEPFDNVSERIARRFIERPIAMAGTLEEAALNWRITIAAFNPTNGHSEGFQEIPCGPNASVEFRGEKLVLRSPGTVSWWVSKP